MTHATRDDEKRTRGLTLAHVTDLSEADAAAFAHAVVLAERTASTLVTIHASEEDPELVPMPRAVELLARWGRLPSGARPGDEQRLGMRHECVVESCCDDVVETLLSALARVQPALLVAGSSNAGAVQRLLLGSVAGALALQVPVPTLIVPRAARPFVSPESGALALTRILVAAGDSQSARAGALHALWLAELAGASALEVELMQVGGAEVELELPQPTRPNTELRIRRVAGSFEEQFLSRCNRWPADLMVMATRGHDSPRDVLLGSHAEHVLHRATCPVLSIRLQ